MSDSLIFRALKNARYSTVSLDTISSYYGLVGDTKVKFLKKAKEIRDGQWNKMDLMTPEEKIEWARKNY